MLLQAEKLVDEINQHGRECLQKEDYTNALWKYKYCIEISDYYKLEKKLLARGYVNGALVWLKLGEFEKCTEFCLQCIGLDVTEYKEKVIMSL